MYTVCIYIYIYVHIIIFTVVDTIQRINLIWFEIGCVWIWIYSHPIYDNIDREIYDQPADFGDT